MAQANTSDKAKAKPQAKAEPVIVRFKVGANIGSARYEVDDTAPLSVFPAATGSAWLEQGLIEKVEG